MHSLYGFWWWRNKFTAPHSLLSFHWLLGHDVVISVLGFPKQIDEKMTKFTESMEAILKGMEVAKVTRIITISAWFTDPATRDGQYLFDNMWSKLPGLVNTLNNEGQMDRLLRKSDEQIIFTSVLVPTLSWVTSSTNKRFAIVGPCLGPNHRQRNFD